MTMQRFYLKTEIRQMAVLAAVWLAFLMTFVARMAWSVVMPVAGSELMLTQSQKAAYISAFYMSYALMVLPGGILADKLGYKKVLAVSLLLSAAATALMATVTTYYEGLLYRLLLGLFCGPVHASCLGAIGQWFSVRQRPVAVALFMTATSFGLMVVNMYAPQAAEQFGWHAAFSRTAVIILSSAVIMVLLLFFIGVPPEAEQRKPMEKSRFNLKKAGADLLELVRNRNVLLLACAGFFATGTTWSISNWANQALVSKFAITPVEAGSVMKYYALSALLAKPVSGFLGSVIKIRRNRLAALTLLLFTPALLFFAVNQNPALLYLSAIILGCGAFIYSPLTGALSVELAPAHMRSTSAGFVNTFQQVGTLAAPMILGGILEVTASYERALLFMTVGPIIGALFLLFIKLQPDVKEAGVSGGKGR
jgi:sugar phosphate permease